MRTLKLCLQRGDLATFAASCIVTSANDSLVGTLQPTYWRFISRHSVDGKLREAVPPHTLLPYSSVPGRLRTPRLVPAASRASVTRHSW